MATTAVESGVASAMVAAAVDINMRVTMNWPAIHWATVPVARPVAPARARNIRMPVVARANVCAVPVRVIPRPHADEYAVCEVARSPVTIRRTRIRIICVVTIGADRLNSDGHRANSNPDSNSYLRLCARRREKQNSQ